MYGYNLKAKLISLVVSFALIALTIFVEKWGIKVLFFLATVLMVKDLIIMLTAKYSVTQNGLRLQDKFRDREVISWDKLEYITITKKNKKWVALVMPEQIHYLKQDIEDREALLHDIIKRIKDSRTIAIHDDINERFNLGLNLDDEGHIIHSH